MAATELAMFEGRRVLIVTSSYPFDRDDFRALFVHDVAVGLAERGADVSVVTPKATPLAADFERWDGVDVHRFGYPGLDSTLRLTGGDGMWRRLVQRPARAVAVPTLMSSMVSAIGARARAHQPDLVIAHWLVPTALATVVALSGLRRVPILAVGHGSDVHLLRRAPGGSVLLRWLGGRAHLASTNQQMVAMMGARAGRAATLVMPLGIKGPAQQRTAPFMPDGVLRVAWMGRLVHGKGARRAIEAVMSLPGATISVAGEGGLRPQLERLAAASSGRARLVGAVTGAAKSAFFDAHDVLMFAPAPRPAGAFEDNLPASVLEALAHGLPVVATSVGAIPSVVGGGGVVAGASRAELAGALAGLHPQRLWAMSSSAQRVAAPHRVEQTLTFLRRLSL